MNKVDCIVNGMNFVQEFDKWKRENKCWSSFISNYDYSNAGNLAQLMRNFKWAYMYLNCPSVFMSICHHMSITLSYSSPQLLGQIQPNLNWHKAFLGEAKKRKYIDYIYWVKFIETSDKVSLGAWSEFAIII